VEELRALLTDAVRIRLRADVPVGAYLSGGLDSSTIAALVRELGVSHLDTFSIAFSDPQFDESEHQRRMAQYLGTEHQVVYATHEDIGSVFPDVVWHAESALTRTAPAPMFLLSRLVRQQNYKVVLTGEAADEMLAGYDIFKEAKVRRFWARQPDSKWRPSLLRRLYPDIADLQSAGGAMLRGFFANGLTDTNDPFYSHAIRWRNNSRCRRLLVRREERGESVEVRSWELGARGSDMGDGGLGDLEKAQWVEVQTFLSTYLLSSQGDRMGMANSVEGRFPFLDYRVVELCSRLPSRVKLRVLRDKHLLREMARGLVPAEISSRPKRPYRAPIQKSFLNAKCKDWVTELLSEEVLGRTGLFHPAAVRQLLLKAESGRSLSETDNMALVGVISGQLLHHRFVDDFSPGRALDERDDVKVVRRSIR
jgi:asparagine synthase (glutamine-hydrolysing)